MRRHHVFMVVVLFAGAHTLALAKPSVEWEVSYGILEGQNAEAHPHYVLETADGGFLAIGDAIGYEEGWANAPGCAPPGDEEEAYQKVLLVKVGRDGEKIFQRTYSSCPGHQLGNSFYETADNYVLCGSAGQRSFLIFADKATGAEVDRWTFDLGSGSSGCEFVSQLSDGRYVVVGFAEAEDPHNSFYAEGVGRIGILAEDGTLEIAEDLPEMAQGYRAAPFEGDGLIVAGLGIDNRVFSAALLAISPRGADGPPIRVRWSRTYPGSGGGDVDHMFGMDLSDNALAPAVFLTGHTSSENRNWDTLTMKIDPKTGRELWRRRVGDPRGFDGRFIHDEAWGVRATPDGGCVVVAGTGDEYGEYSECRGGDCSDSWKVLLVKFNAAGDVSWTSLFGGPYGGSQGGPVWQDGAWIPRGEGAGELSDWAGEDIALAPGGGAVVAVDNGQFGFLKLMGVYD